MKTIIFAFFFVFISIAACNFGNQKPGEKKRKEAAAKADQSNLKQIVFGKPQETRSLHQSDCTLCNNAPYTHGCFDHYCFAEFKLEVSVPAGWTFTGKPFVNCVVNNEGSFEWNNFANAPDRFKILQRGPNYILAEVFASSRKITINLACEATRN